MLAALTLVLGLVCGSATAVQAPSSVPPSQPANGPGGAEYSHASVVKSYYELPLGAEAGDAPRAGSNAAFWIFEPAEPPTEKAPVVAFFHGFGASDPAKYGAWIDHLVRRGKIVVYPLFQAGEGVLPDPAAFTPKAFDTLAKALEVLSAGPDNSKHRPSHKGLAQRRHTTPDLERIAYCGHSIGGLVAVEVAARIATSAHPAPKALFAIEPGSTVTESFGAFPSGDLSQIQKGTLLLALAGDADSISGDVDARRIYRETTSIPKEDKDLCVLHSDDHGTPSLRAHHLAPLALDSRYRPRADYDSQAQRKETDALDFYGPWKLFDALCDAAFDGTHREYALGNTPEQRFMGRWSDGHPVVELDVLDL